jgi:hypothetical protein
VAVSGDVGVVFESVVDFAAAAAPAHPRKPNDRLTIAKTTKQKHAK